MITEVVENNQHEKKELMEKFPNLTRTFLKQKECPNIFTKIYSIKENNEIIGYMVIDIIYERMELIEIEILEKKRRRGYGNALIEFMIQKANTEKLENITLEVREDNKVAISLYEKNGFQKVAIRKHYYQDVDGILMERKMM